MAEDGFTYYLCLRPVRVSLPPTERPVGGKKIPTHHNISLVGYSPVPCAVFGPFLVIRSRRTLYSQSSGQPKVTADLVAVVTGLNLKFLVLRAEGE